MPLSNKAIKRYTVIDNKTGYVNSYSWLVWNLAWAFVFVMGYLTAINLS